ncbi:MAG: tyrosine-type recombinase/integrase [Eubacteriaceae bacterium]
MNISEILDKYLNYLQETKNMSSKTIKAYYYDLKLFFKYIIKRFLRCENIDFDNIDISEIDVALLKRIQLADIYAYLNFISKERNNNEYANNRKISSLNSFFNFTVHIIRVLDNNPVIGLQTSKIYKKEPKSINLDTVSKLLKQINGRHKLRDKAIIILFINCGLRLSELTNIKLIDIDSDYSTLKIINKTKERILQLNQVCRDILLEYITSERPDCENEFLFLSQRKTKISNRTVQNLLKCHVDNANLNEGISPNTLRHTAAKLQYDNIEVDVKTLQKFLGHSSLASTEIYINEN